MTMKMDHSAQAYVVRCDECPEHFDTEHVDFTAAREAAKEKGWRAYIGPDKKWANSCPACCEKFAKSQRR